MIDPTWSNWRRNQKRALLMNMRIHIEVTASPAGKYRMRILFHGVAA